MTWIESRQTVCIDFDGVLNDYKGYADGMLYPINDSAIEFIKRLKKIGFKVVILSSRRLADIEGALKDAGIEHLPDLITNVKVPAIAYIDDRAITFRGDFDQTLKDLMDFKTWWEDDNTDEKHGLSEENLK